MARDEAMMFPNERIKTWLVNSRTRTGNAEEVAESIPPEELNLELDTGEAETE